MPWRMLRPTHVVDLMYNVGELYPMQSRQALQYLRLYWFLFSEFAKLSCPVVSNVMHNSTKEIFSGLIVPNFYFENAG